jgi:hypothetical protein
LFIRVRAGFFLALACVLFWSAPSYATPTFLSAINISVAGQDAFEPQVVVDPSGNVIAVWTRSDGTDLRIQAATRTPSGPWSTPVNISDSGSSASSPAIAVDPSGNVLAVWTRVFGAAGRIQASYRPAGGSFGASVNVSDGGGDASAPTVSMDNSGKAAIAWARFDGTRLRIQATTRTAGAGGTIGAVQTLSDPGQDGFEPRAAAGPNVDNNAAIVFTRSDGTNLRVQSSRRRDPGGFPRPKGATPMIVSLVVAYNQCTGSGNRTHGPALARPSCNPPVSGSSVLTVGTGDTWPGTSPNFQGNVRLDTIPGNANTELNEADVKLKVSMTDVRNKPALSDYVGRVLASIPLQITDNYNSLTGENPDPATTQTFDFKFPVDCTLTTDTSIGAACALTTSTNAIYPGAVLEGKRTIWQLGQVVVKDAGPNGTGYASCPPTCGDGDEATYLRQGIWVP